MTTAQGEQLAREYGMKFMETSAKANVNVTDAFLALATDVVERLLASGGGDPGGGRVNLSSGPSTESSTICVLPVWSGTKKGLPFNI